MKLILKIAILSLAMMCISRGQTSSLGYRGKQIINTGTIPADSVEHVFTWTNNTGHILWVCRSQLWNGSNPGSVYGFWSYLEVISSGSLLVWGEGSGESNAGAYSSQIFTQEPNIFGDHVDINPGDQIRLRVRVGQIKSSPAGAECIATIWYREMVP